MQNLIYFLLRFGHILLFFALEIAALSMVVNYNEHQKNAFLDTSNRVTSWLEDKFSNAANYLRLSSVSKELAKENAVLMERLASETSSFSSNQLEVDDTLEAQRYKLVEARVISNSVASLDNYLTLDKGRRDGIEEGMGVISKDGVVGIVTAVTARYARAISLLNRAFRMSVKIEGGNYFGYIEWEGNSPRLVRVRDVPKHALVSEGDKVSTSGYSAIFPAGLEIGEIISASVSDGSNFYSIEVRLIEDLSSLEFVYVVNHLDRAERQSLETGIDNESDTQ